MQYIDKFDRSSSAWVRGACTPSEKSGNFEIRPEHTEDNVTLSGMVVNPCCFDEFEMLLQFGFSEKSHGSVIFGFGKPFEWSSVAESGLQITIYQDGNAFIAGPDGGTLAEFNLMRDSEGLFTLKTKKKDNQFVVQLPGENISISLSEALRTSGFFTIKAQKTPIHLHEFQLYSPIDAEPWSEKQRKVGIDAWKRWRMDSNYRTMNEICEYARESISKGEWGYNTDISVTPGLVNVGETVTLTFRCKVLPVLSVVTVEPDYLGDDAGQVKKITLDWQHGEGGSHFATLDIVAVRSGNWRIVWNVDGERLTRIFGVVEKGYTVCTLWVGSNVPDIDSEIHKFDLPGDYWVGDWWSPFDKTPQAVLDYIKTYANFRHRYGDVLVPFINAGWILPCIPNFNLFEVDSDLQVEGFKLTRHLMETLEIGNLELLGTYTMGHETPAAALQAGVKGLTSMCVWQNWLDGSDENCWKINHWGAPIVPYYMADDDFRKVADQQGVISFNMGTGSSVRNYSIFCLESCPTNTAPMRRYTEDGAIVANINRFYYAVDGWLNDAKNNSQPLFITIALENFGKREEWRQANEMAVEYLVKTAKDKKVVFASAASIADYYLDNYIVQPEHVFYQHDVYCGIRPDVKPAVLPDRIEFSNHLCHSLHSSGQTLPQILWDYTAHWHNPVWDDMKEFRVANGLITPEIASVHGCVPKNVDLNEVDANVTVERNNDTVDVTVLIDLPAPMRILPISIWRLPLSPKGMHVECDSDNARWQNVVDGFTDSLNGLVICENLSTGRNVIKLKFSGVTALMRDIDFMLGKSVCGREVTIDDQHCVYLWRADNVGNVDLCLTVTSVSNICVMRVDGKEIISDSQGRIFMTFDDCWQNESYLVIGASRELLQMSVNQ